MPIHRWCTCFWGFTLVLSADKIPVGQSVVREVQQSIKATLFLQKSTFPPDSSSLARNPQRYQLIVKTNKMKRISGFLLIFFALFPSTTGADHVDLYVQLGKTVTLPMGKWHSENFYTSWFIDSNFVIRRNSFGRDSPESQWKDRVSLSTSSSLTIQNIQRDEKNFKCELTKQQETKITTFTLYPVSIKPPAGSLMAGETLNLKCDLEKFLSGTQMKWLDPEKKERRANNDQLTVKGLTGRDHGEWTCVLTYQGREEHVKTFVTVIDLSLAPLQYLYTSNFSSPPLHLPCSFPSYVTWSDLRAKGIQGADWTFKPSQVPGSGPGDFHINLSLDPPAWGGVKNKRLDVSAVQKNNLSLSLEIKGVTKEDRGTYTCTVAFKNSITLKREIHVEVLYLVSSSSTNVREGQQVNLTCGLGHPLSSDLKLKWIQPSSQGPLTSSPDLTFFASRKEGNKATQKWRCELWRNNTKLTTTEISLKIDPVPLDMWLLITITAAAVVFILLLILTVILIRRHRKGLIPRRRKHRFCRCKDPKPKGFYRT
ncbi:hypothetical protein DPEC_G00349580 [Dallia pectoralis]|uniref:Uncharacterized protein n=1 Tax=Dallia pectoralis TaxID=75939 RepID=A0ACC2F1F8_DALPE|nr:hypothetical protein DPEC_G00349580 [Dallia pectoralis]